MNQNYFIPARVTCVLLFHSWARDMFLLSPRLRAGTSRTKLLVPPGRSEGPGRGRGGGGSG